MHGSGWHRCDIKIARLHFVKLSFRCLSISRLPVQSVMTKAYQQRWFTKNNIKRIKSRNFESIVYLGCWDIGLCIRGTGHLEFIYVYKINCENDIYAGHRIPFFKRININFLKWINMLITNQMAKILLYPAVSRNKPRGYADYLLLYWCKSTIVGPFY